MGGESKSPCMRTDGWLDGCCPDGLRSADLRTQQIRTADGHAPEIYYIGENVVGWAKGRGLRLNGFLGLSQNDRTILFYSISSDLIG